MFSYNLSRPGLCGSILIAQETRPRIIGVHVAGHSGRRGYSQPLWREFCNQIPFDEKTPQYSAQHELLCGIYSESRTLPTSAWFIGNTPKYATQHTSQKSRIEASDAHGIFEVATIPAPLGRHITIGGITRDILLEGINKKESSIPFGFEYSRYSKISQWLTQEFISSSPPVITAPSGVLGILQAINGIPGFSEYKSLEFGSSEGFPWVLERPPSISSKRWMFEFTTGDNPVVCKINEDLLSVMQHKEQQRRDGQIPVTIFVDSLKDARIKRDKIFKDGPTRIFSISL